MSRRKMGDPAVVLVARVVAAAELSASQRTQIANEFADAFATARVRCDRDLFIDACEFGRADR